MNQCPYIKKFILIRKQSLESLAMAMCRGSGFGVISAVGRGELPPLFGVVQVVRHGAAGTVPVRSVIKQAPSSNFALASDPGCAN